MYTSIDLCSNKRHASQHMYRASLAASAACDLIAVISVTVKLTIAVEL